MSRMNNFNAQMNKMNIGMNQMMGMDHTNKILAEQTIMQAPQQRTQQQKAQSQQRQLVQQQNQIDQQRQQQQAIQNQQQQQQLVQQQQQQNQIQQQLQLQQQQLQQQQMQRQLSEEQQRQNQIQQNLQYQQQLNAQAQQRQGIQSHQQLQVGMMQQQQYNQQQQRQMPMQQQPYQQQPQYQQQQHQMQLQQKPQQQAPRTQQRQQGSGDNRTGFEKLQDMNGLHVSQLVDAMEFCGCDFENAYEMYNTNQNGKKKGSKLFTAREESGCCARNFCRGPARPFKIFVEHVSAGSNKDGDPFLELDKPCVCWFPGLCCNRPEINVYLIEDRKRDLLGKILLPCQVCQHELQVVDANENDLFQIVGESCQLGLCCKWAPCDKCQYAKFEVVDDGGQKMAKLEKKTNGCCASAFTDTDNFVLKFPDGAKQAQRALLLSTVIFLDFMFFEQKC